MEVPLTQGKVAQIDDEDWPLVAPYRWYAIRSTDGRRWYAVAVPPGGRNRARLKMHNLIMGTKWVDHRDGDGLNNRRANLRKSSNAQNQQNTASRGGTSRFKGVSWNKRRGKWIVRISVNGKELYGGYFPDEISAALHYDELAKKHHGEFARLNFADGLAA